MTEDSPGPVDDAGSVAETRAFTFDRFELRPAEGLLLEDGRPLPLPPRAVALLACLVANPGQVLSKDHLLNEAWPDSFVSEDSLTHAVSLVRQTLGDDAQAPRFIQTVPRRGYRFVCDVQVVDAADPLGTDGGAAGVPAPPPPVVAEPTPAAIEDARPGTGWRRRVAWVAFAGVVVATTAVWVVSRPTPALTPTPETAPIQIDRLAVESFATPDRPSLRAFAEALPTAIADLIERETKLTVLPGEAGAGDNGADAVLSGEIQPREDAISVIARVRSAASDDNWWRQEWLLPAEDLDVDAFARSLVSRVRFLLDLVSPYSTIRRSSNAEATLLVVQASELLLGPAQQDLYVGLQAADALGRAVSLDPGFARARAGRVAALAEIVGWRPLTPAERDELQAEAEQARGDDPDDPIVHIAVALAALLRGDMDACRAALDRAVELAPGLFWIYMIRADVELRMGLTDVALASVRRGLEIDPYLPALYGRLVDVELATGDLDAAASSIERLRRFDPGGYWSGRALARLHVQQGDLERAEQELLQLRDRWADAPWVHRELADFYRATGREAEAVEAEAALEAFDRDR